MPTPPDVVNISTCMPSTCKYKCLSNVDEHLVYNTLKKGIIQNALEIGHNYLRVNGYFDKYLMVLHLTITSTVVLAAFGVALVNKSNTENKAYLDVSLAMTYHSTEHLAHLVT